MVVEKKINKGKSFKIKVEKYIIKNYKVKTTKEMAEKLSVTTTTINNYLRRLVKEEKIEYHINSKPKKIDYAPIIAKVRREYSDKTAAEIAEELGVPRKCVYRAASILIKQNQIRSKKEDWDIKDNNLEVFTNDRLKPA